MVEHRSTWSRRISIISVAVVFFLCTLVLVGWKVHRTELVEVIPNLPPMSPWSAICFLGLSGALFLKLVQTLPQFQKKSVVFLQFILITTSLCIALIHFIENFTVIKFQIDDLLFPKFVKELDAFNMAHMSFQASLLVFFLGGGFLLVLSSRASFARFGQILLILAGGFGLFALVGHMYGVGSVFRFKEGLALSLPSAVCSIYSAIGILALRTDVGVTTFFVEQRGGSILVRQLLWASLIVPLVLSLIISWAEDLKIIESSVGSSLFTVSTVGAFFLLIGYVAKNINDAENENLNLVRERTARMQAEEAVKERDEFLSICSHELKTPLTSLQLQYEWAQHKIQSGDTRVYEPENTKKRIENTNRQIKRLGRLIEDMLDVSRVTSGKLLLDIKKTNLTELINEVILDLKVQLEAADTLVEVSAASEVILACDRHWIGQVATNLLTNAGLKYGAGKPVRVVIKNDEKNVTLTVEDRGMGIAPEDLERIFRRFERGVSAESFSGLGLGLYITRQIIDGHSGTIDVKSEPGKGSVFKITLPSSGPVS